MNSVITASSHWSCSFSWLVLSSSCSSLICVGSGSKDRVGWSAVESVWSCCYKTGCIRTRQGHRQRRYVLFSVYLTHAETAETRTKSWKIVIESRGSVQWSYQWSWLSCLHAQGCRARYSYVCLLHTQFLCVRHLWKVCACTIILRLEPVLKLCRHESALKTAPGKCLPFTFNGVNKALYLL